MEEATVITPRAVTFNGRQTQARHAMRGIRTVAHFPSIKSNTSATQWQEPGAVYRCIDPARLSTLPTLNSFVICHPSFVICHLSFLIPRSAFHIFWRKGPPTIWHQGSVGGPFRPKTFPPADS